MKKLGFFGKILIVLAILFVFGTIGVLFGDPADYFEKKEAESATETSMNITVPDFENISVLL